ncbi:FAD-dependent monooxygenase [Pandoraea pneumonica]|uniref:FAD-dependent monooxygenase n=1 Tax=Pandoraea pneumonica TaxID=2508299 RepID=UPI003CF337EF
MKANVLISGAGVSGLALAYWLDRAGFATTVVERAPELRRGGQAIDIRGVALDVTEAMGLLAPARALRTRLKGMSMLDAQGNEIDRTEERTFSGGPLNTADFEIFRDDLCEVLMGALSDDIEWIYDDSILALDDQGDRVMVRFERGAPRAFDLVIGADGTYSNVRRLCFNDEASVVRPLNMILALFTTPNQIALKDWQLGHREGGVGYIIYPSLDQTTLRVAVGFEAPSPALPRNDTEAQKRLVTQRCESLGGDIRGLIDAMQTTDDFHYNELAQIRMPSWSKGRVALAGDAAHCASPFSGQGTSLALVGAAVLAYSLARHWPNPSHAFAEYEGRMRPYVDLNQAIVDMERKGPIPDAQMEAAKHGIEVDDLLSDLLAGSDHAHAWLARPHGADNACLDEAVRTEHGEHIVDRARGA